MMKPNDYWEKANRFKKLAIRAARMNIQQQQSMSKQRYDAGRANPIYTQGDLIWVKVLSGRTKLDSRFHGPFIIIEKITDVKYIIEHAEEHYRQEEHVNNFIPFYDRN